MKKILSKITIDNFNILFLYFMLILSTFKFIFENDKILKIEYFLLTTVFLLTTIMYKKLIEITDKLESTNQKDSEGD